MNIFNWSKAVYNQEDSFKGKRNEKRMLMTISKGKTVCPRSLIHSYKPTFYIKYATSWILYSISKGKRDQIFLEITISNIFILIYCYIVVLSTNSRPRDLQIISGDKCHIQYVQEVVIYFQ